MGIKRREKNRMLEYLSDHPDLSIATVAVKHNLSIMQVIQILEEDAGSESPVFNTSGFGQEDAKAVFERKRRLSSSDHHAQEDLESDAHEEMWQKQHSESHDAQRMAGEPCKKFFCFYSSTMRGEVPCNIRSHEPCMKSKKCEFYLCGCCRYDNDECKERKGF